MENPAKAGSPTLSFWWHGSRSRDRDAALRLAPNDHAKTLRALASHTSPHIHFCTLFEPSILPLNESTNLTPKAVAMVCCQFFSTKAHYNQERRIFFLTTYRHAVGRKGQERKPHARAAHPEARAQHQCRRVW